MDTASYDRFADGPWLTRQAMEWFWDAYLTDPAARIAPTASPLRAPLAGLPPALVITDEADVLRDEGEAYARRLGEAGVDVTAVRYGGGLPRLHDARRPGRDQRGQGGHDAGGPGPESGLDPLGSAGPGPVGAPRRPGPGQPTGSEKEAA